MKPTKHVFLAAFLLCSLWWYFSYSLEIGQASTAPDTTRTLISYPQLTEDAGSTDIYGAADMAGTDTADPAFPTDPVLLKELFGPASFPTETLQLIRGFEAPPRPWLAGHRGIDLGASANAPVLAPAAGEISFVGYVVNRPVLSIRHANGFISSFEPIISDYKIGEQISRNQVIGHISAENSHCYPQTCLHWGVRHHGEYINPLWLVPGFGPPRLIE